MQHFAKYVAKNYFRCKIIIIIKKKSSVMGNSMSSHPTYVTHHLRFFWNFYQWLILVLVYKTQIFSLIQFVLLDLWPVKDAPYRPLPSGQKLHFHLAAFSKNCNILRIHGQIKLKICNWQNFRVLNQNLIVKRDEYKWKWF